MIFMMALNVWQVLYLKNLHSSVTGADLDAVFGAVKLQKAPHIRLMTGKLRGQAFITFPCKDDIIMILYLHTAPPPIVHLQSFLFM